MTKTRRLFWIMALTWLVGLVAGQCCALAEDMPGYPPECVEMFKEMDRDGDGKVTLEEFVVSTPTPNYAGRKMAKESFVRMDKNGDGFITIDEFCIVKELKEGEKEPTPEEQCEELFKKYDTDGDGKLSLTEFMVGAETRSYGSRKASKETFLLMDRNHDSEVTQEEFCAANASIPAE